MKIDILTLFPNMFDGFINESIIKRAIDKKLIEINIHNIRDYSQYNNKKVDDYSYGGGAGMVLMCDPIFRAIEELKQEDTLVIMLTPSGKTFTQNTAKCLSKEKHIILLCGHYEGFDERIKTIVDLELSIGEYVLTGGEIAAMAIADATTRLHVGIELVNIGLFEFICGYAIAQQNIVVVHKHISHFFYKMVAFFAINSFELRIALFDEVNHFAYLAHHP